MSTSRNPRILESTPEHEPSGFSSVLRLSSTYQTILLAGFVGVFSYLAAKLGGALVLRPQMIWPLWPGCAFLVAVLLQVQRKAIWPALLAAGLAGFALYDLQAGLTFRSIALLLLADTVEVLAAALAVSYAFNGTPRLTSVRSLAKYSLFAGIIAPIAAAVIGAHAVSAGYLARWKVGFLTESLALLTLTPAILSWADMVLKPAKKPVTYYFEIVLMFVGLVIVAYFAFVAPGAIPAVVCFAFRNCGDYELDDSDRPFLDLGHYPWAGPVLGWRSCQQCVLLTAFLFVRSESFHVLGSSGRRAQRSRARTSTWSRTVSAGSSNRKDVRIRMGCH